MRTIAYNVLAATGYPPLVPGGLIGGTAGAAAGRFATAIALFAPDILTFCEAPPPPVTDASAALLGLRVAHFPSPELWPGALMTRFEILEADGCPLHGDDRPTDLFTRHWGRALLALPARDAAVAGAPTLAVHSAHLHPSDRSQREREVAAVVLALARDRAAGHAVLVQGDLNHLPATPEHARWVAAGLIDAFARAGVGEGLTFRSTEPLRRIDYAWAGGTLGSRIAEARVLAEPPFVPGAEPEGQALSDHLPLLVDFR